MMSAETERALEEAVMAHVASESDGDMVGAWLLLAQTERLSDAEEGRSAYNSHLRGNSFTMVGICDAWKHSVMVSTVSDS
jgi:hypothetical protein